MAPLLAVRAAMTDDRGSEIINAACGFLAASAFVASLRLGLRIKRRLLSWDDAAIAFSICFSILQTVAAILAVRHGYGAHVRTLSKTQLQKALFWFYIVQIAYKGTIWPAKLSILLLYRRVFMDTPNVRSFGIRFRTAIHVMIVFIILFFFTSEIVSIFACLPVHHYWNRSSPGTCRVNTLAWWFSQSVLNTASDIIILLLPMPLIRSMLKIPVRQKVSLMGVFALGIFVTACTIVRMTTFKTGIGADTTYDGGITLLWSIIETNVAIICACLPLLRPLFARIIPAFGKTLTGSQRNTYGLKNRSGASASASNAKRSATLDGTTQRGSWTDWKDNNVISAKPAARRTDSDEESFGVSNERPFAFGGITKQTDVEITLETASDHGSQRHLTDCVYEPAHLRGSPR
ncbi:hypothetical protein MBLNU459_g3404t1 [Dothideomycetes sp. NU459]